MNCYKNLIKAKDIPQMNKKGKNPSKKWSLGQLAFSLKKNLSQTRMD